MEEKETHLKLIQQNEQLIRENIEQKELIEKLLCEIDIIETRVLH